MNIVAIINPISGGCDLEYLKSKLISSFLADELRIYETSLEENAFYIAQNSIVNKPDIIIVCGGDGTVSPVIEATMHSDIPIGIIPVGTGNLLAFNLGIPADIDKAIEIIKQGNEVKTDIGKINGKIFASVAGCGFDAYIIDKTTSQKKKRLGILAYFVEGYKFALNSRYSKFKIIIDGEKTVKIRAVSVLIVNKANIFGESLSIVPKYIHNDGKFDIVIMAPISFWGYAKIILRMFFNQYREKSRQLKYFQAEKVEIYSSPDVFSQADGEIIGKTPVKAEILKNAARIIVPLEKHNISKELVETCFRKIISGAFDSLRSGFVE